MWENIGSKVIRTDHQDLRVSPEPWPFTKYVNPFLPFPNATVHHKWQVNCCQKPDVGVAWRIAEWLKT